MRANTPQPQETAAALLSSLDERIRAVAAETFREMSRAADTGAVKVKTAARMLDMCETRVRELIRDGKLKVIRPTARTVRVPLTEIKRYTEANS
jgi:excisionase family DNA binding protein